MTAITKQQIDREIKMIESDLKLLKDVKYSNTKNKTESLLNAELLILKSLKEIRKLTGE